MAAASRGWRNPERWTHSRRDPRPPSVRRSPTLRRSRQPRSARQRKAGDALAREIYETVGHYLGRGLAMLVDVLNPERIVIGSIYGRQQALLEPAVLETLHAEAHPRALEVCRVVPAGLGEHVGDYAGLAVAAMAADTYEVM